MPKVATCGFSAVLLLTSFAPLAPTPAVAQASLSRDITWDGDRRLTVSLAADVVFKQSPRAGVTVTGERELVEHIRVRDGKIYVDSAWAREGWEQRRDLGKVKLTVSAPAVEEFIFNSGGSFAIENYDRDRFKFTHNGGGSARVSGVTQDIHYVVNGGAAVDLSRLAANSARVVVNGGGDVKVGAKQAMAVHVNGSGSITLLNKPRELRKGVIGAGRIIGG